MQDDCVIFEVKVNADAPHGVSWDRFEPFTSCMSLTVDLLDNKHLLLQQEAHRLRGPQEPGRHLLHELPPSGTFSQLLPLLKPQLVLIAGAVLYESAAQGGVQDAHGV